MDGIQYSQVHNFENPYPGCLGRMVNLFDTSAGVARNRLLMEKSHHDGSALSRTRSDVARILSPIRDPIEDKVLLSEFKRSPLNEKLNGTPIKMLIAHEISKEVEAKHNPPSVVAKLMGLDALPHQQSVSDVKRNHSRSYSCNTITDAGMPMGWWPKENDFFEKPIQSEDHHSTDQTEYKDIYEIWQKSQRSNCIREKSPLKAKQNHDDYEKKMALVRQKFVEAKRLSTDDRLRQSKEFQDALEVLSSNKDLFLKFLQEPTSLFSRNVYENDSILPSPETKRNNVFRPSKLVDDYKVHGMGVTSKNQIKKSSQDRKTNGWNQSICDLSPFADLRVNNIPTQPTRIVVLKPSPGKTHEPPSLSPRNDENYCEELDDEEAQESREAAKEITWKMHENFSRHRRDETLLSSVFSIGYNGDESSFNKSENESALGTLSDSEVVSPTSKHSWDFVNGFGSPLLSTSFSRLSYSPGSSVCKEAKKRLSERWAMMALNGNFQENRQVRRMSSTLGEMLALSEMKKPVNPKYEDVHNGLGPRETPCLANNLKRDDDMNDSPRNLLRSQSVPVSPTIYDAKLNVETPDIKELTKAKSMKTSFKGKVSSLLFSRTKKSSKETNCQSPSKDESESSTSETPMTPKYTSIDGDGETCLVNDDSSHDRYLSPIILASSRNLVGAGSKQGIVPHKAGLSVAKHLMPRNPCENQGEPSPISVLEPPFEEDNHISPVSSSSGQPDHQGIKSNLIDKSPPIESISRTLTWDDSGAEPTTSFSFRPSLVSSRNQEQDWLHLVQTLLSGAGLGSESCSLLFLGRCHSSESPLDPYLREKYVNQDYDEFLHDAKRKQMRVRRKLVFDCVNAALVDIIGGLETSNIRAKSGKDAYDTLVDGVWSLTKECFSDELKCNLTDYDGGNGNNLVVEKVVTKEVVGKMWSDGMRLESDIITVEIEKRLLEELVEEAVVEFRGII